MENKTGYTEMAKGGANFPMSVDGKTYHCLTKKGEVANRMIFCGSLQRAGKIAKKYLEPGYFDYTSERYIRTLTGMYKRKDGKLVPVSICGTGMGIPMTDFSVRENRAVVDGEIAIIRLGTSGCVKKEIPLGDLVLADECISIRRNPDGFRKGSTEKKYTFTLPVKGTTSLCQALFENLEKLEDRDYGVHRGLNASCCSFYSSQGRLASHFADENEKLIDEATEKFPTLTTLEMESFHQYDLAEIATVPMHTCAVCMVLAQRKQDTFLDMNTKQKREFQMGKAALETLANYELKDEMKDGVWNKKKE